MLLSSLLLLSANARADSETSNRSIELLTLWSGRDAGSAGVRGPQRGSPAGVLIPPAMSAQGNEVKRSANRRLTSATLKEQRGACLVSCELISCGLFALHSASLRYALIAGGTPALPGLLWAVRVAARHYGAEPLLILD